MTKLCPKCSLEKNYAYFYPDDVFYCNKCNAKLKILTENDLPFNKIHEESIRKKIEKYNRLD